MKVLKTSAELKTFMLEQMVSVADGTQEAQQSKAICNYAQQVYNLTNLELKFAVAKTKMGNAEIPPVQFIASE